jgi:hypothetical protein
MAQSSSPPSTWSTDGAVGVTTSQTSVTGAGSEEEDMEVREEDERERVSVLGFRKRCGFGEGKRRGCSAEYGEAVVDADAADAGGDCGAGDGSTSLLWSWSMAAGLRPVAPGAAVVTFSLDLIFFSAVKGTYLLFMEHMCSYIALNLVCP